MGMITCNCGQEFLDYGREAKAENRICSECIKIKNDPILAIRELQNKLEEQENEIYYLKQQVYKEE